MPILRIKKQYLKNWGPQRCLEPSEYAYGLSCYNCNITSRPLVPSAIASGTNSTRAISPYYTLSRTLNVIN